MVKSVYSPPWLRRGGRDLKKNIAKPLCWERTGWLVQTTDNRWLEPTPSARAEVASRNFLDRAATPPYPRRGVRSSVGQQPLAPVAKIVSPLRGYSFFLWRRSRVCFRRV